MSQVVDLDCIIIIYVVIEARDFILKMDTKVTNLMLF